METLIEKPVIRARDGITYVTAFARRESIKEQLLRALNILKRQLPDVFVAETARRMAAVLRKLFGANAFPVIVPAPCGHSQRDDCLSVRPAQRTAREVGASLALALAAPHAHGSSHPHESRKWRTPKVLCDLRGKVLVMDDVATTGVHISRCLPVLRRAGADAMGVAWIGPK